MDPDRVKEIFDAHGNQVVNGIIDILRHLETCDHVHNLAGRWMERYHKEMKARSLRLSKLRKEGKWSIGDADRFKALERSLSQKAPVIGVCQCGNTIRGAPTSSCERNASGRVFWKMCDVCKYCAEIHYKNGRYEEVVVDA